MRIYNVAHVDTEITWRGGERQVIELIKGLRMRGHQNTLVCRPDSAIAQAAARNDIPVFTLPLAGEWDIRSIRALRSFIRNKNIDIIHTHTSHAQSIGLFARLGISECRLVVARRVDFHLHSIFSRKIKYSLGVDRIITVSDAVKRILIEDGIDPSLITTVRSGFIHKQYDGAPIRDLRNELGIPPEAVVVASVAALAPHKDHNMLLKAAHIVKQHNPDVRFLLAGEGALKDELLQAIHNLGLDENVYLLDFVEDIQSVFNAADIFAMSSREEGLCTSILDAMYFNLPIVATNAGGIPELVQDQVNGFIVRVGDHQFFADRLNFLIENASRRRKMAERSKQILDQHNMDKTIDGTLAVYQEIWRD